MNLFIARNAAWAVALCLWVTFCPAPAQAGEVEHTEALAVDTVFGTSTNPPSDYAMTYTLGRNFEPGRTAVVLLKWDMADPQFTNGFNLALIEVGSQPADTDMSASIHQMITDWDGNTDFGTTLPVPGVHYVRQPIAAVGWNNNFAPQEHVFDSAGISPLAVAWANDPALNKGVIFIPRGQLNFNYPPIDPVTSNPNPDLKAHISFRDKHAGIHVVLDTRIDTGTTAQPFSTVFLEAIEDTSISSDNPGTASLDEGDDTSRGTPVLPVGLHSDGTTRMALFKFGLGELLVADPTGDLAITQAQFEPHEGSNAGRPAVSFDVHRMLVNWDEATATWNQFGTNGPTAGIHYATNILGSVTLGGGSRSATFDISAVANDWFQSPEDNFGVICVATGATDFLELSSSERSSGFLDVDDTRLNILQVVTADEPAFTVVTNRDTVIMTFNSVAGADYNLQATTDLTDTSGWPAPHASVRAVDDVTTIYDDPEPDEQKSYRLEEE